MCIKCWCGMLESSKILIAYPQTRALQPQFWILNPQFSYLLPPISFIQLQLTIVKSSFSILTQKFWIFDSKCPKNSVISDKMSDACFCEYPVPQNYWVILVPWNITVLLFMNIYYFYSFFYVGEIDYILLWKNPYPAMFKKYPVQKKTNGLYWAHET